MLSHPSVRPLGHRTDVQELMRSSDVLVLPSIEEGSALVASEAIASGCIPLVSRASTAACRHGDNALVHDVGDVQTLEEHITTVYRDEELRTRLRAGALRSAPELVARPYVMPPNTPADIVKVMRDAFAKAIDDKELIAEGKKSKLDLEFTPGDQAQKILLATNVGKLSLILRQAGESNPAYAKRVTERDLARTDPVAAPAAAAPRSESATVSIIRNMKREEYTVMRSK